MTPESVVAASAWTVPPLAASEAVFASVSAAVVWGVPPLKARLVAAPIVTVPPLRFVGPVRRLLWPIRVSVPAPDTAPAKVPLVGWITSSVAGAATAMAPCSEVELPSSVPVLTVVPPV